MLFLILYSHKRLSIFCLNNNFNKHTHENPSITIKPNIYLRKAMTIDKERKIDNKFQTSSHGMLYNKM